MKGLPEAAETLEIRPEAVAEWVQLAADERPRLIDCREQDELGICQIMGNEWYPLALFSVLREKLLLRNERGVVVYCHHGVRSLRATHFLRSLGVENTFSMAGGIEDWSLRIDPKLARY